MRSSGRALAFGLAAGRMAIGAGLWGAPQGSGKALGFDRLDSTALALGRLAASRDLALGAWQLHALDEPERLRRVTALIAAVDAADALTFALALGGDAEARRAGIRGLPVAVAAAAAGLWLSRNL